MDITIDPTRPGRALVDTYAATATTYFTHREAKAAQPDGAPAGRSSRGLLHRRHVHAASMITVIGKEANDLDERAAGITPEPHTDERVTVYRPRG